LFRRPPLEVSSLGRVEEFPLPRPCCPSFFTSFAPPLPLFRLYTACSVFSGGSVSFSFCWLFHAFHPAMLRHPPTQPASHVHRDPVFLLEKFFFFSIAPPRSSATSVPPFFPSASKGPPPPKSDGPPPPFPPCFFSPGLGLEPYLGPLLPMPLDFSGLVYGKCCLNAPHRTFFFALLEIFHLFSLWVVFSTPFRVSRILSMSSFAAILLLARRRLLVYFDLYFLLFWLASLLTPDRFFSARVPSPLFFFSFSGTPSFCVPTPFFLRSQPLYTTPAGRSNPSISSLVSLWLGIPFVMAHFVLRPPSAPL